MLRIPGISEFLIYSTTFPEFWRNVARILIIPRFEWFGRSRIESFNPVRYSSLDAKWLHSVGASSAAGRPTFNVARFNLGCLLDFLWLEREGVPFPASQPARSFSAKYEFCRCITIMITSNFLEDCGKCNAFLPLSRIRRNAGQNMWKSRRKIKYD